MFSYARALANTYIEVHNTAEINANILYARIALPKRNTEGQHQLAVKHILNYMLAVFHNVSIY